VLEAQRENLRRKGLKGSIRRIFPAAAWKAKPTFRLARAISLPAPALLQGVWAKSFLQPAHIKIARRDDE
jgi:hypothetical protein